MGSSNAKKLDRRKDFQKTKLKVGKSKPKATNFTGTEFKAKGIALKTQSLSIVVQSDALQTSRYVAHLASASESQRKESLSALSNVAMTRRLPASVLPRCLTLVTDASHAVRMQLLKLLKIIPREDLAGLEERLVLHLQGGMTSISIRIRDTTLDFLDWAIEHMSIALVRSSGGWLKILRCFWLFFGWPDLLQPESTKQWTNTGYSLEKLSKDKKIISKALDVLARFLMLGMTVTKHQDGEPMPCADGDNIMLSHHISRQPKTFSQVGVFGEVEDTEMKAYTDVNDRVQVFRMKFEKSFMGGLSTVKRHGGDLGRSAANVERIIAGSVLEHS